MGSELGAPVREGRNGILEEKQRLMGSYVESKCDVYVLEGECSIDESRDLGKPKSKTKCMLNKRAYGLAFSPLSSSFPVPEFVCCC